MPLQYCPRDQRNVETEHSWNTTVLILLLIFLTLIGLIYLAIKWKRRCPICHLPEDQLLPANTAPVAGMPGYAAPGYAVAQSAAAAPAYMAAPPAAPPAPAGATGAPQPAMNCPSCGSPLTWMAQYNRWWCAREQQYR